MTSTLPTQEQVDRIAAALSPDVVRIRLDVGRDWSDDPAVYFRVILSDAASRRDRLSEVARRVRSRLDEELSLWESDHIPYVKFRSESEQAQLREAAWD